MKRYILDTNVVLCLIRGDSRFEKVDESLKLSQPDKLVMISVVSVGELLSLAKQFRWGARKQASLNNLLDKFIVLDINKKDDNLMNTYAEIDAYSQGKLPHSPLNVSARNMGKNDLWIAATAFVSGAELVTMDADFDHLNGNWIVVNRF